MLAENLLPTAGNAATAALYVEDVFATSLFNGTGSAQTITNDIDLAGKGGMVWWKNRDSSNSTFHNLIDTVRGSSNVIFPNDTSANISSTTRFTGFNSNGFGVGYDCSVSGNTHVAWAFRKQAKFFDVVTYTGDGNNSRQVFHALGSAPGMVMVKNTTSSADWRVYHISRSGGDKALVLNSSAAEATFGNGAINDATSTYFRVDNTLNLNNSGQSYVAYIFAHNAGGFGASGNDNVISCGTFNTISSTSLTVELGYEPQFLLFKDLLAVDDWQIYDVSRGMSYRTARWLRPNVAGAEANVGGDTVFPTATGFRVQGLFAASRTIVYMAIRRPMKPPTTGTSVYSTTLATGTGATSQQTISTGLAWDAFIHTARNSPVNRFMHSRLQGLINTGTAVLNTNGIAAENISNAPTYPDFRQFVNNDGYVVGNDANGGSYSLISHAFRRAAGFFDVVCYTGTGVATTQAHNLGAVPEMIIIKNRNNNENWAVYHSALGNADSILLNLTNASLGGGYWSSTTPTSSVFNIATQQAVNYSAHTYVAFLFGTVAGVSKVGSYTGTAALQTINCGFTGGARFVLIKRKDSTGDWYVYNTATGITSGNDPYYFLNSNATEVTNTNYVDTDSTGFKVTAAAPAGLNASGGTYIFLAIA